MVTLAFCQAGHIIAFCQAGHISAFCQAGHISAFCQAGLIIAVAKLSSFLHLPSWPHCCICRAGPIVALVKLATLCKPPTQYLDCMPYAVSTILNCNAAASHAACRPALLPAFGPACLTLGSSLTSAPQKGQQSKLSSRSIGLMQHSILSGGISLAGSTKADSRQEGIQAIDAEGVPAAPAVVLYHLKQGIQ